MIQMSSTQAKPLVAAINNIKMESSSSRVLSTIVEVDLGN